MMMVAVHGAHWSNTCTALASSLATMSDADSDYASGSGSEDEEVPRGGKRAAPPPQRSERPKRAAAARVRQLVAQVGLGPWVPGCRGLECLADNRHRELWGVVEATGCRLKPALTKYMNLGLQEETDEEEEEDEEE